MTRQNIDWSQINAYVDGELPAPQAARIADAAAEDDELARQIAALTHMKHAVSAEFGAPPQRPSRRPARRRRHAVGMGLAATFLVAVCTLALGLVLTMDWQEDKTHWADIAAAKHAELSEQSQSGSDSGALLLASLPRLGPAAFVPDLSAAKLRIGGVASLDDFAEGRAVAIGYYGTRGCRLTVLVTDAELGLSDKMQLLQRSEPRTYGWRMGQLSYLVMASRMAPKRLATIAGSIHWSSVRASKPDDEIRTALRVSRRNSPPCSRA